MAPAHRKGCAGLLIYCCVLQLLCCTSSQQISKISSSEPSITDIIVLRDTVTVTSRQTVGQETAKGSSSSTQHRSRTIIDCSQLQGKPAYLVKQGDLTLQNVILQGCTRQAIVMIGPSASLTARNVTFSSHGTSSSSNRSQDSSSSSSRAQGIVISAQRAAVTLDRVVITGNKGALPHGTPYFNPPCSSSSIAAPASTNGSVCGSPVLASSLIHLQDSTLTARDTTITDNTAGAVISTSGSAQHSLQLLAGTQLQDNTATWLIVADSFLSDAGGRENLLAPHPSEKNAKQKLRFKPVYTTYDVMWHLKSMKDWHVVLPQQVVQPKVLQYVGRAPSGQSPLQLQMRNASISQNTVAGGLLWLRLVNTSMHAINISSNVALEPAVTSNTLATAAVAARLASSSNVPRNLQPPHLCDVGALERALLQVQGAAAFDMYRCNISHNVQPAGAIIRVSDGVGLSSIRSSVLSDNVATAVLRMDGRSWVHDAVVFMNATQATDSSFYRQAESTSEIIYQKIWLPRHRTEQANYDKVTTDTTCFVMDSRIERNAVFHAVVLAKGERVDWRSYEYAKARAALAKNGSSEAAADVTMETFNAANWWSGNTFARNTFIHATTEAPMQGIEAASYVNALSFVLSGSRKTRSNWTNRTLCEAALRSGSLENTTKVYNVKPAVFAGTFGTNFLAGRFESNVGFPHVVSMHSVTLVGSLQMRDNVVNTSVLRIIDATAGLYNSTLEGNRVHIGSVLQGDSFVGRLEQVTVADNTAAPDQAQPALNDGNAQTVPSDAGAGAGAVVTGSQTGAKWPIVGLQRIDLGILCNVTIANNTAPFWNLAIESNQWNFLEDVVGLVVHNNTASGIRLNRLQPYYDRQGWVMRDSRITGNKVTQEAGALLLEGFNSRVGKVMPITLHNCVIANNTPAPGHQAPPKGGGIAIQGPTDDRADGSSDRGFLEFLDIRISSSLIQGNMASEGGGIWSAWPMLVVNTTVQGNTAENAGGGFFLRGLQQDKLGLGNVVMTNSSISNNTARFGGAIACDSCRTFLYGTDVSGNRAAFELPTCPAGGPVTNSSSACANTSSSGHLSGSSNGSCMLAGSQKQQQQAAGVPVKGTVLGAGGAFAAILKGRSFLRICGESAKKPAAVIDNRAATVGGLMYMQYEGASMCSAGSGACGAPAESGCVSPSDPSAQVFAQSSLCGAQFHNIDWSGTNASVVGHVLAWTAGQQQPPFSMHCHPQAGHKSSGSSGGGSSATNCGCGDGFAAARRRAGMPYLGIASNMTETLLWQLPNQMSVMHTGCLIDQSSTSRNSSISQRLEGCLLADGRAALPAAFSGTPAAAAVGSNSSPYSTFAGDAVNLTVALTRGLPDTQFTNAAKAARVAPCGNSTDRGADDCRSNSAAVELQQDRTGGLFVIGKSRAVLDTSGLARFCNMALQPIDPPLYNRNYSFSIEADTSSGLLAQVPAVEVTVQLLRCTLGQHMTINRCVRCAESGTFSLHPNRSCQPCVPGGLCSKGLLQPQEGFWSYNPFVPQVVPCPLKGACANRTITDQQLKLMVPWAADAWQQQQQQQGIALGAGAEPLMRRQQQRHHAAKGDAASAEAARGGSAHRQLLQGLGQQPQDSGTTTSSSNTNSSSSSTSSDSIQKQWDRAGALQQYNRWLADLITYDPEQGPFRLYNVTYKGLLDSWQQVQCNRGYKGYMCSACDTAYVDPESASSSSVQPRRFAFHRNRCVDCSTSIGATWFMLFFLFLLFLGYVSLGIFCQIRSVDRDALQADPATHTGGASSNTGDNSCGSGVLPCWQKCWQSGTSSTTAGAAGAAAVAGKNTWVSNTTPSETKQQQLGESHAQASDAAVCIGDMDRDQMQRQGRAGQGALEPAGDGATCINDTSPAAAPAAAGGSASAAAGQAAAGSGMAAAAAAANLTGSAAKGAQVQQQAAGGAGAGVTAAGGGGGAAGSGSGVGASPVHTLVAMWKVLTSYVQILAMVRFLPSLWDTAAPLEFADLSSFSQFAAFDCILPGPANKLAYTRILLTAFGVPALLFVVFLLAWIARWGLHRLGAALHQRAISQSFASTQTSAQNAPAAVPSSGVSVSASGTAQAPPHASAEGRPRVPASESAHSTVSSASGSSRTVPASSSSSLPRSRLPWLQSAASSVIQTIPSAALARLQTFGAKRPPVSLSRYLSIRLTITAVVLGYSCYSLFTSQMLQTLACHPIREVAGSNDAAAVYGFDSIKYFGDLHSRWLMERLQGLKQQAVSGSRHLALEKPALCQGSDAASGAGTCQVSGQFWKQDYSVQCFRGGHAVMAGFGAVLLVGVGVILPVLFGLLLWRNKGRLKEPLFTAKYSFLYHEYREQVCYWEFAIMARKLAFLGIFVALNPPQASPESVTLLQLYIAAALAVGALLLNVFLQPFELTWLNHLECAGLTAVTLTFLLLGASVTLTSSVGGRMALLVLTGVGNFALVCYFVWHMGRIVWQVFGGVVVVYLGNLKVRLSRAWHGQGRRRGFGCLP